MNKCVGFVKFDGAPCCIDVNRNNEYAADKKAVIARIGAVIRFIDKIEDRRSTSAIKFSDGGAAMFADLAINHNIVIAGNKASIPLVR